MLQLEEALSDAVSQAAQHPVVGVAAVEAVASNLQAKVDGPAAHLIREAAAHVRNEAKAQRDSVSVHGRPSIDSVAKGESALDVDWRATAWVETLGCSELVSSALLAELPEAADRHLDLAFVRQLGEIESPDALCASLRANGLLEAIAGRLWGAARKLAHAPAPTVDELHSKFCTEGDTHSLSFLGVESFFGGREASGV